MPGDLIYAFRVVRLPLLDAGGSPIGRIEDLVVVPGRPGEQPRVVGFMASSQRRRIFVNAGRIAELDADGARLRSWDLDMHPFVHRAGELLINADLIGRSIGDETVSDVGLEPVTDGRTRWWEVAKVRLGRRNPLRRRMTFRLVDVDEVPQLFGEVTGMAAEAARLRDMHPSDVATVVRALPLAQRRQLAEAMDDERLADVLEELPEDEQLRIVEALDLERLLGVLDEMEYDDLVDLLGEMPVERRAAVLSAMDTEEADVVRRLLAYEEGTAGGMLTPEIIILGPTDTVAHALAEIRDPDWTPSVANQVFVCRAPYKPPTGTFMGVVFVQRLLREPPGTELGQCLETVPTVRPDLTDAEVFRQFATYNMLALGVVDEAGQLLGAVTVDDVVDRMLGAGWRQRAPRVEAPS
ncbi:MAG: CBS domain-containing protein [Ilumatobacteraceae bacterium]|nr:CBS domain-containing protein [Ilumatobacteraceae bacterium]